MKRSEINAAIREAGQAFERHGWALPPVPRWDVTDFGLGDFGGFGLVLVNLSEQAEYCEKLMHVRGNQRTPLHFHRRKKEDIICRWGRLAVEVGTGRAASFPLQINGDPVVVRSDQPVVLSAGERITLTPGTPHGFWAESAYAIVGEVSTANDDRNDNFFDDPRIGRFSRIDEDEPACVRLVSD